MTSALEMAQEHYSIGIVIQGSIKKTWRLKRIFHSELDWRRVLNENCMSHKYCYMEYLD